ncbi:unnamed protein product [Durusdinium trenchii]|uniref:Pentatricopeptide repeat-containing protein, chloroplastic n=1 Tax=Durusdinium trenchii TaxID=1381693 RepID=A0ABP0KQF6_9DINO
MQVNGPGRWARHARSAEKPSRPTTVIDYNKSISRCKNGNDPQWELAMMLCQHVVQDRLEPNVITYNSTVSVCQRALQWLQALGLLAALEETSLESDVITVSTTASGFSSAEWRLAVSMLERMEQSQLKANVVTYSAVMNTLATWLQAIQLFGAIEEQSVEPNEILCGSAIGVCESTSRWEQAVLLLERLEETGLQANSVVFRAVVGACGAAHQWQHSLEVLGKAQKASETHVATYNAAISACGKAAAWEAALAVLHVLRKTAQADVISFSAAINSCEKASQWQQALILMRTARSMRSTDAVLYSCTITACAKWQAALYILRLMGREGSTSTRAFNAAITAMVAAEWQQTLELYHETRETHGPDITGFNLATTATSGSFAWQMATALLCRCATHDSHNSMRPDVISHNSVLSCLPPQSEWQTALFLQEVIEAGFQAQVITYNAVMTALTHWSQSIHKLSELSWHLKPSLISYGKIVTKLQNAAGKKAYKNISAWTIACQKARKELGIKGFCAVGGKTAQGKALYAKAKAIFAA